MTSRASCASLAILVLSLTAAGCARKAAEAPPQVAVAPPAPAAAPEPEAPAPEPSTPDSVAPASPQEAMAEFQPAFFDFDSYRLDAGARDALDADARMLRTEPDVSVLVEGHCDERGTVEYNQALGERRAEAARDYLVATGIEASRIEIVSYGKDRPFANGHDEEAWARNRRAHVVVR